jgi:hypothetical protein
MTKGAKKGENRFKTSQEARIQARLQRIQEIVIPKMKSYLDLIHFKNKTKFQEMCAEVFNEDLPVNMKVISRRTIANSPYWNELGPIYYLHYGDDQHSDLETIKAKALNSFSDMEKREELEREISNLTIQNEALIKAIGEAKLSSKSIEDSNSLQKLKQDLDDLICVIDFLVKATEGIVVVDKENNTIINMADDLHGKLPSQFAKTYFKHIGNVND